MIQKNILVANWKMSLGLSDSVLLAKKISNCKDISKYNDIVIAPSYHCISDIYNLKNKNFYLSSQDCSVYEKGAFTGDISAEMLKEIGCEYAILGHSERRIYYNESEKTIKSKIITAQKNDLSVFLCVGENLEAYNASNSKNVIEEQIMGSLNRGSMLKKIIIAYEPIWAIGTNITPKFDEIEEMHKFIKKILYNNLGKDNVFVLYGGSLNPNNAEAIFTLPSVNGGLIGGASLKAKDFLEICSISNIVMRRKND